MNIASIAYSQYFTFIGLKRTTASSDIIEALKTFIVYHWPYPDYTGEDINEIHADAGTYFTSEELTEWLKSHQIKVVIAAPKHQEMNGLAERLWQTARIMAFKMMTHARLGLPFFHHAIMYAWQVCVVLPANIHLTDGYRRFILPTTPHYLYF
jgi:transposase InsO family protein